MKFRKMIAPLIVAALLLTTGGLYYASTAVTAQEKQSKTEEAPKTPTGFATGTKCTKTGTYRAANEYLEIVIPVKEGDEFPTFADGSKAMWYPITPSTRSTFEPIKVSPGSN